MNALRPMSKKRAREISSKTRAEVQERSGGRCEARIDGVCTGTVDELHHRQRRALGDHTAGNLLAACNPCHVFIHAHPIWARAMGFIRSAFTPSDAA